MKKSIPLSPAEVTRLTTGQISGTDLASIAGISRQRACALLRQGRTPLEIAAGRRGLTSPNAIRSRNDESSKGSETLADLQKSKLRQQIERDRLELATKTGELVHREVVDLLNAHVVAQNKKAVRELLFLPALLRDRCDGQPGAVIERIWNEELLRVLRQLSQENLQAIESLGIKPGGRKGVKR